MVTPELEYLVETKVKPLLKEAMNKSLGITIQELQADISDRLKNTIFNFQIDTRMKFKEAKRRFKQSYISGLLKQNLGNIETVAKIAAVDRRSIHRIVAQMRLDVEQLREQLDRKEYFKQAAVQDIIQGSLEHYKNALHPKRYDAFYKEAPKLSKDILKELPEIPEALKVVEKEFEKKFISQALAENNNNISKTARKIGLRFETLHRKMKKLGL
ncbi:MAG TPA: helix-turn-helix domain-containing protein [Candidatus Nanoarchaeia archaeon]|nr:helix-turn-helix domain-containing protein [Candidatus Nanoarchaeia archaeon]